MHAYPKTNGPRVSAGYNCVGYPMDHIGLGLAYE